MPDPDADLRDRIARYGQHHLAEQILFAEHEYPNDPAAQHQALRRAAGLEPTL